MNTQVDRHGIDFPSFEPVDILAGLASADRQLLATALALFEDSKLQERVKQLYAAAGEKIQAWTGSDLLVSTESVRAGMQRWLESEKPDEYLRLVLWIYLREALGLPARMSVSLRGISLLAEDVTAAAITFVDAPNWWEKGKQIIGLVEDTKVDRITLSSIVEPVLQELLESALSDQGKSTWLSGDGLLESVRQKLSTLSPEDQKAMLASVGADELNDAAVRQILLTGGGLATFGTAVSLGGFSSYILAAQASAFIPFVSGPGLVSLVAVIANPMTIIGVTAAAIWWGGKSVNNKVQATVAIRVLALLALQGKSRKARGESLLSLVGSFKLVGDLKADQHLTEETISLYLKEWELLSPITDKPLVEPDTRILWAMDQPFLQSGPVRDSWLHTAFPGLNEQENAAILAGLTLGDALYSACAINPSVLAAADFSRVAEIDSSLDFAEFATEVMDKTGSALTGAFASLKGYTAEQFVAAELMARGHVVSFPESSNQAGFDLLVDGLPTQVKFHDGLNGLHEHFAKYDYPVYANSELMGKIPEEYADKVFFIEGLSNELVEQVTRQSVDAGADLMDPDVPMFAVMLSAGRHLIAFQAGQISGLQAVEQVLLDGGVRAGLALAGQVVGGTAGLLLFGPAGAWVFGAGLPILAQANAGPVKKVLVDLLESAESRQWKEEAHVTIDALVSALQAGLAKKREELVRQYQAIDSEPMVGEYVRWRIAQDGRFLAECKQRLDAVASQNQSEPEIRAAAIVRWLASVTLQPACFQQELAALGECLQQRPGLLAEARQAVEETFSSIANTLGDLFRKGLN